MIIFLDFDGVLNSQRWMEANRHLVKTVELWLCKNLDHAAVARVEKISKATGAKVVISSSWRRMFSLEQLQQILKDFGFTGEVIGITPKQDQERGIEIQTWLNEHGPIESFVILDDDSDMVHLMHKLVQTTFEDGLQDEHVEKAIAILENK
jgi:uncharacterized protein YqgQ